MCSRRVFSNKNNINFIDYNNIKKGEQIYKNINSKGSYVNDTNYIVINNEVKSVLDYDTFLNLTKTYFRRYISYSNNKPPTSINDGKTSFVFYNKFLSHNDSNYCGDCNDTNIIYECNELQKNLYPYGNFVDTEEKINNYNNDTLFKFPVNLNVNNNCIIPNDTDSNFTQKINYNNCCCKKSNGNCCGQKVVPCVNYMFPSQNKFICYNSKCQQNYYDAKTRMNSFSIYPQIDNNKKNCNFQEPELKNKKSLFICK